MDEKIKKGNTLLVKGPSRVTILKGKVEVFGKIVEPEKKSEEDSDFEGDDVLIIPSANLYPLYALENSEIEVYTNSEENLMHIKGNSIPQEWIDIKDKVVSLCKERKEEGPLKVMTLGVSCGKTTLIKYIANNLLRNDLVGAYLDSDLGQQIIHLPTTISIAELNKVIIFSEDLKAEDTVFIGSTFPKGNYKFIVSHLCKRLIDDYVEEKPNIDCILIDSDGWVKSEAGIVYKSFFIKQVDPDVLIVFQDEEIEEIANITENAEKKNEREIFVIEERNQYYYEKEKEERRFLRQSQFARVLETFRKITIPIDDIKFIKRDYDKESNEIVEVNIEMNELIQLPYHYVIIALLDKDSNLINIGLLFTINLEKDYILLFSKLSYKQQLKIKKILIGSLRLSTKGNHQGYLYL